MMYVQVIKHRISAFYGTDLDLILRANQIHNLILTGVATNNAVELTAREAHDREYDLLHLPQLRPLSPEDLVDEAPMIKGLSGFITSVYPDKFISKSDGNRCLIQMKFFI